MPEELKREEPMIDVGETEGAEIDLDAPKVVEEKEELDVVQEEQTASGEEQEEEVKEEKKEDELSEYSEGVKKRIAKLTRKMREAERQKEEAIAYAQSVAQQQKQLQSRFKDLDTNYVSEFENRVQSNLEAAKIKLKNAIDNQDVDGQIAAQTDIARLTMDAARLNQVKSRQPKEQPAQEQPVYSQQQQQQSYANAQTIKQAAQTMDPKAESWAEKNPWFGTDSAMTYTAFDIHKQLTEDEGYDPSSDEYYAEVDKRIKLEFPHKFATTENTTKEKPSQTVASAKRPATTGRRKTVKLTPSQVAIAKRLGVPLEEYAKQLIAKEA